MRLRIGIGAVVTTRSHKGAFVVEGTDKETILGRVLRCNGTTGSRTVQIPFREIASYQLRLPNC